MAARAAQEAPIDHLARVHLIREVFARSPLFREAVVSEPLLGPAGEVVLAVSFDRGPAMLQVVADTEEKAHAILLKLAEAMVDVERWHWATVEGLGEPGLPRVACGVTDREDGGVARPALRERPSLPRGREGELVATCETGT